MKFNADEWVRTAKEAGMKYIVITSKHHDGFAMFDSKASDWNIVKATPFGRDPSKELAAACRKYGLKLGFYYSQAQDWNNGGAAIGGKWDPAQERRHGRLHRQGRRAAGEGDPHPLRRIPAVLWWDTPADMNKERAEKLLPLLKLQARHHPQQPPRRRLQGRHRDARAVHPRHRLSRAAIGRPA